MAAAGLAVGGGMFVAAEVATIWALALLILARPVKQRLFPNRKEARRVMMVLAQDASLAELGSEVDAADVRLDQIVVLPSSADTLSSAEASVILEASG